VGQLYIEPGSSWENGYAESFIGKLSDELLNGEIFDTVLEARVVSRAADGNRISSDLAVPWDTDNRLQRLLDLGS
jgi:hypothetical protein